MAAKKRLRDTSKKTSISYGNIKLHPAKKLLSVNGESTRISTIPTLLLEKFLEEPAELIEYDEFISMLWGEAANEVEKSMNVLRVHMCYLKRMLKGEKYVQNVSGRGYVFDTGRR